MSDWYKDETANLEFEKEMIDRYGGYKASYRIWQERAERMKDTATRLRGLLRALEFPRVAYHGGHFCALCKGLERDGHADDCKLDLEDFGEDDSTTDAG